MDWLDGLVADSDLPTRAKNALARGGFYTLRDVQNAESYELLRLAKLGRGTLREIEEWFAGRGKLAGERRRDVERQIRAMEARKKRLAAEVSAIDGNIAHAKARLAA